MRQYRRVALLDYNFAVFWATSSQKPRCACLMAGLTKRRHNVMRYAGVELFVATWRSGLT